MNLIDLKERLAEMEAELEERDRRIADLGADIHERDRRIAELEAELDWLWWRASND